MTSMKCGRFVKAVIWSLTILLYLAEPGSARFSGDEKVIGGDFFARESDSDRHRAEIIVTLKGEGEMHSVSGVGEKEILGSIALQRAVIRRMARQHGTVTARLENMPIFSARVDRRGMVELAGMPEVAAIEKNREMEFHTAQGIPLMNPGRYRNACGGKGVAVAVVDSGINYDHPALGNGGFPNSKVIGGYDFGDNDGDPIEGVSVTGDGNAAPSTHGTCCAGIVAGAALRRGAYAGGVAPEAKLYALKVQDKNGRIDTMAVLRAWDWCIAHQYDDPDHPIMVISNSFGITNFQASDYCDKKAAASSCAAARARARGIAVFVSSGNESQRNTIACPSCLKDTIAVGAVFDGRLPGLESAPDRVAFYSNSSEILDLLAPSHNACAPGSPGGIYVPDFGGTSAACPYAAGAAAVIQSCFFQKNGRFLPVETLRRAMVRYGAPIRDMKSDIEKPRVDMAGTINALSLGGVEAFHAGPEPAGGNGTPGNPGSDGATTIIDY